MARKIKTRAEYNEVVEREFLSSSKEMLQHAFKGLTVKARAGDTKAIEMILQMHSLLKQSGGISITQQVANVQQAAPQLESGAKSFESIILNLERRNQTLLPAAEQPQIPESRKIKIEEAETVSGLSPFEIIEAEYANID